NDAVMGILNDLALGQARNDSAALALIVQQHMVRGTRAPSRGVRQAPFLVLSGTRMPSALVEIGFISHPREGRMLGGRTYQGKVAQALADGVRDFADKVLARRLVAQVRSPAEKADGAPVNAAAAVASPAAITGGYAALGIALRRMQREKALRAPVAAISVGILAGQALLDLDYEEDFSAEVDMNVVGNAAGELLEVQGTAEKRPFTPGQLNAMVGMAQKGLAELHQMQLAAIAGAFVK